MTRLLCLALLGVLLTAGEAAPIATTTVAGAEVVTVTVPAGWSSAIFLAADRDRFTERPDRVLINGGYFDHPRLEADPVHRWLRGLVVDVCTAAH